MSGFLSITKDTTDDKIVSEIQTRLDEGLRGRQFYERQWYVNYAFYLGHQWLIFYDATRRFYVPPAPSWRVRLTSNLILPMVRTMQSRILRSAPSLTAVPATSEPRDLTAARGGTKILRNLWAQQVMPGDKQQELTTMMLVYGTAFVKTHFNPQLGDLLWIEKEAKEGTGLMEEPLRDADGRPMHAGELQVDVTSPFEIVPDPAATRMEDCRWIIHLKAETPEAIYQRYGIEVEPEKNTIISYTESTLHQLLGERQPQDKGTVLTKEYWELPSPRHPKGRLITVAGNRLVAARHLRYPWLPYAKYDYIQIPGRFWGMGLPEPQIPLQKEYNRSRSQVVEHKNLMSRGKWLVPVQANVGQNALTSEPGEKVYYFHYGGPPPQQIPIQPMPNYVFQNISQIRADMNDIAGIHEVSQARIPGQIRSGQAISALQELDETQLGLVKERFRASLQRTGQQILWIVQQLYDFPRTLAMVGSDYDHEVVEFRGADLESVGDIMVQLGDSFPASKSARQSLIMSLWDRGVIKDPARVLKLLDLEEAEDFFRETLLDEAAARMENDEMEHGKLVEAKEFHGHEVHQRIHNEFRKTQIFKSLPEKIQQTFGVHDKMHAVYLDRAQKAAIQQQLQLTQQAQAAKEQPRTQRELQKELIKSQTQLEKAKGSAERARATTNELRRNPPDTTLPGEGA